MAVCKIRGLLLRHFFIVLLQLEVILYVLRRQDNFQLVLSNFMLKVS